MPAVTAKQLIFAHLREHANQPVRREQLARAANTGLRSIGWSMQKIIDSGAYFGQIQTVERGKVWKFVPAESRAR